MRDGTQHAEQASDQADATPGLPGCQRNQGKGCAALSPAVKLHAGTLVQLDLRSQTPYSSSTA
ncbi:hypothetical protein XAC3810_770066 [Xanthomonas citri pv. citri]|uniref:Uncharacterized protein n=1 Tax=Xanthomonas citri pv. citri TaxID=611301 RepID=A0A0U5FJW1_XANCI|nr:Hypothetical Protein XCAW_00322 [Xanthomonas citri subsp. citri Aw12879]CEE19680.1 hypothetical protein XAC902_1070067 [Xanthomonas citri pv. citri]CEE22760.1 hypothetical protein XAC908_1090028 [Xanthomonas citri pv. citri]CEE39869.1 hypothetical protein XAC3824_920068 [Xanthomonas citri pv. citri]CEE39925.1 hypothetical protein XAC9322_740069 [Xanthomonas citri pv. citri]